MTFKFLCAEVVGVEIYNEGGDLEVSVELTADQLETLMEDAGRKLRHPDGPYDE
jgi:hypothetical protein